MSKFSDTANVQVRGLEQVQAFLKAAPRGTRKAALDAISEYLLGNDRHGLRHMPPYKYVRRATAYGNVAKDGAPPGYFSMRQFRFVMAMIHKGIFTPGRSQRTGATSAGWYANPTSGGYQVRLVNETQGGKWTQADQFQARQPALVGWRKAMQNVSDNMRGALHAGEQAISRWIKDQHR